MAKLLGKELSGRLDSVVLQAMDGYSIVRSMPSRYKDRKSKTQLIQRGKMRNVLMQYKYLKDAVNCCFEKGPNNFHLTTYNRFLKSNLQYQDKPLETADYNSGKCFMTPCCVSEGTLEPIVPRVVDNHLELEMEPETWQLGDILRFISVRTDGSNEASVLNVAYSDTVIQSSSDVRYCTISSEPLTPGMYAWVHLRPKSKGMYASTQMLIKI